MSIPRYSINSITYASASSVLTINSNYENLRGGGSFSILGTPTLYWFGITDSAELNNISTYSISLSASTVYSLTFSFYKGPYNNKDAYGITSTTLSYDISRLVANYSLQT